jgi:hypothetical protein
MILLAFTACSEEYHPLEVRKQEAEVTQNHGELIEFRALPHGSEDCNCYMRVLDVENALPFGFIWSLSDLTHFPPDLLEVQGSNNYWMEEGVTPPVFYTPPSPFQELPSPSYGQRAFVLGYGNGTPSEDFTIHVEVKCIHPGPGPVSHRTKTHYHSFRFGDGAPYVPPYAVMFNVEFDCHRAEPCCADE